MQIVKLVVLLIAIMFALARPLAAVSIVGSRGIILAEGHNEPLYSQRAAVAHHPASLTKVLTVVLALERGDLNSEVIMNQASVAVGGSSLNAAVGDRLTLRELVYAAMLISANDASNGIAIHLAGSLEAFSDMMNTRAAELGMINSHFVNAHGMPHPRHMSTAADLALLGLHAASLPMFLEIAGAQRFVMQSGRILVNQNRLLGEYRGLLAGKTGYTDEAGQCLLLIAERDGLRVASVVLGSQGRAIWSDSEALLNFGFTNFARQTLVIRRQTLGLIRVPLAGEVLAVAGGEFSRIVKRSDLEGHSYEIRLQINNNVWPPLSPMKKVGEAIITSEGTEIGRVDLTVPTYVPLVTIGRVAMLATGLMVSILAFKRRKKRWKS